MSNHTPGPWKIGAWESGMLAVDGANDEQVTGFIEPADALLIAAAPELLDALKGMLCWPNTPSPEAVRKAQAALSKATGEFNE